MSELLKETNKHIEALKLRGFDDRDRLLRKLQEEAGEYAEAVSYSYGDSRKVRKFDGKISPTEKLQEEVVDLTMIALALANLDGLKVADVLGRINEKLSLREEEYWKDKV